MDAKIMPEIEMGTMVCNRVKIIFHPNENWIDCYNPVAIKFTLLKKEVSKQYKEKSYIEVIKHILSLTDGEIESLIRDDNNDQKKANQGMVQGI